MSWSDKEIDKLFQEMDNKASFEFQESYWAEMEQMLHKKQANKKFVWWLNGWILLPIAMILIGSTVAFSFKRNKAVSVAETASSNPSLATAPVTKAHSAEEISAMKAEGRMTISESNIVVNEHVENAKATVLTKTELNTISPKETVLVNGNNSPKVVVKKTPQILQEDVLASNTGNSNEVKMSDGSNKNEQQYIDSMKAKEVIAINENQTLEVKQDNNIEKQVLKKAPWQMYIGVGTGMASNLQAKNNHYGAGIIRFEYGFSKAFNRFTIAPSIAVENTFGTSVSLENRYVSYDFIRKENMQQYKYNRFTNFMAPIRLGYALGKSQKHQLQAIIAPTFTMYNNLLYQEKSNGKVVAKDQYFNQDLGLNRFFVNVGFGYNYQITRSVSIGFEYNNNIGLNRKKALAANFVGKADHQFIIQLRYFIK